MRAMILAAGYGKRLLPLTKNLPKPLVKIAGKPIIEYALANLKFYGVEEVVINVSYLGQQIIDYLQNGAQYGLQIVYSKEEIPLGTVGGICKALPLLGAEPFLVLSADAWLEQPLPQLKLNRDELAQLVMIKNPLWNQSGDFNLTAEAKIVAVPNPEFTYANLGLFDPKLFSLATNPQISFAALIKLASQAHLISGQEFIGNFHNINNLDEYYQLTQQL